ncbi:MAG: septum formation family protein [Jatrophihabitantaceae bacterium]
MRRTALTPTSRLSRRAGLAVGLLTVTVATAGCGVLGGGKSKTSVSVFDIKPGQCFNPPATIKAELSKLSVVGCGQPHTEESYADVPFANANGSHASAYPGDALLKSFADGACAQRYTDYVGRDYLDSSYFFTYLLPSARGWEQHKDRNVVCFVTTTGQPLTATVKGSKR